MIYVIIWFIAGFLGGLIGFIFDHFKGRDFTVSDFVGLFWFTIAGPISVVLVLWYISSEISDKVLIRGKKK